MREFLKKIEAKSIIMFIRIKEIFYQYAMGNPIRLNDSKGLATNSSKKWKYEKQDFGKNIELHLYPSADGITGNVKVEVVSYPYCKEGEVYSFEKFIQFSINSKKSIWSYIIERSKLVKVIQEIKSSKTTWNITKCQSIKKSILPYL